jgi:choline dehydrogenase-like flavoprotein
LLFDLEKNQFPSRSRYDLIIIGAGAAGISIAKKLINKPLQILLIESGDFEFNQETQDLYMGETEGNLPGSNDYLHQSRLRYFGGTTNHWSGWCRPLDTIDFEERDWVPNSGWPISRSDLEPYYRGAEKLVGINPFPDLEKNQTDWASTEIDQLKVRAPYFQFSTPPTRFGTEYREELLSAENIDILINANLNDIRLNDGKNHVETIHAVSLNRNEVTIQAKQTILAAGGIENPRILLNCRNDIPAGIGNQNGVVGKYFIEHPHYFRKTGWLITWSFQEWDTFWYKVNRRISHHLERARYLRVYSITEKTMKDEELLNISVEIQNSAELENSELDENGKLFTHSVKELSEKFLMDPGVLEDAHISKLYIRAEQEPVESNRVSLIDERDQLGMQKVKLRCQVFDHELDSYRRSLELMARAFGLEKSGRMRIDIDYDSFVTGGAHHIGTTRMSNDPKKGVVDSNCKVHGLDNLYIAGSSVFPTAGFANPTLTILAISLRLADYVEEVLKNE